MIIEAHLAFLSLVFVSAQVIARHVDFSSGISPQLLSRLLLEFPAEWMRPNCSSLQLLQQSFRPAAAAAGTAGAAAAQNDGAEWLATQLPAYLRTYFEQLRATATETATETATSASSSSAPAATLVGGSGDAPMMLAQGADMQRYEARHAL